MSNYDVPYMHRTRDYYRAQGYASDYQWAQHDNTPFTPLSKPLQQCKIGIITTAMPDTEQGRTQRQVYSVDSRPIPESLFTSELSWHKSMTHTDDVDSFLPLAQLQHLADAGRIGSLARRFHCAPTEYSQRNTKEDDAPLILERCMEDQLDLAILVPL